MTTKEPGPTLEDLRKRAGLSRQECAEALGLKSASGYQRYEQNALYQKNMIPAGIINVLIPLFRGRGTPPIREEELIEISELRDMKNFGLQTRSADVAQTQRRVPFDEPDRDGYNQVPIRYRAELGAFRDSQHSRHGRYGVAPFQPLRTYDQQHQFAVVVSDMHAESLGLPNGTILHTINAIAVPPAKFTAGAIVVAVREHSGMEEVIVASVVTYEQPLSKLRSADGESFLGEIIGLPVYRYGPV